MITTNKVLPKEQDESGKRRVLNTNKLMPKEYDTEKQEATIIRKPMLTTGNMEGRKKILRMELFEAGRNDVLAPAKKIFSEEFDVENDKGFNLQYSIVEIDDLLQGVSRKELK